MPRERQQVAAPEAQSSTDGAKGGLRIEPRTSGSGELCRRLLNELPDWFGIPEAMDDLVAKAERAGAVIAIVGGSEVGLMTLVRHTEFAAEIDVMAVAPDHHRQGIGRAMLEHAERLLAQDGVEYLQVKTLAETVEYEPYASTRAFYAACGFRPLQVFPELWDPENPALQLIKRLKPSLPQAGRSAQPPREQ
jgi:GNAT superfamily N-acetyltransferase